VEPIRVVVNGALGRMGREVTNAVLSDSALKIVGAVELEVPREYLQVPMVSEKIPFSSNLDSLLLNCKPNVLVDFTTAISAMNAARIAIEHQVNMVIGTTGLSEGNLKELTQLCQKNKQIGIIVAPNFSLGAVLLKHLAKIASTFFDYAEIVEMHHEKKIDAPSGTAIDTAKAMLQSRGKPFTSPKTEKEVIRNTRGGDLEGLTIHSMRLPGFMASQEVIFGGLGQTLRLRHDSINRESFMPGVILAIKEVVKRKGLIVGLETLLNL
jgi:4-hydroxy-tetrahydrodipicolinate reductase